METFAGQEMALDHCPVGSCKLQDIAWLDYSFSLPSIFQKYFALLKLLLNYDDATPEQNILQNDLI